MSLFTDALHRQMDAADILALRCRRLETALQVLLDRAVPIPTEEGDRQVGWSITLNDGLYQLVHAALNEITPPHPETHA